MIKRRTFSVIAILMALCICMFAISCNNEPQVVDKITWKGDFASAPENPSKYDSYYNTTDGCSYIYDGTQWTLLAKQGNSGEKGDKGDSGLDGQSIVWKGSYANEPANPSELWAYFNTTDGCSYIYQNGSWSLLAGCGTSISWLGSFATAPENSTLYAAYYNSTDGCSYIYDGTQWTLLAKQGDQGETGAQGEKGEKGDKGDAGLDGQSIIWKGSFETDPENPSNLWAYFNTTDGCSYIYQNGEWDFLAGCGASIIWFGSYSVAPEETFLYAAYYNTTDGCSYIYDGTQWTLLAKQGETGEKGDKGDKGDSGLDGQSIIWKGSYSSASELTNPRELWAYFNTTDGCSYIYQNGDWGLLAGCGTSITWLGSFATAPNNPELYFAYYNTTDGSSYIYDGTQWTLLAKKGAQGEKGETGDKGDKGDAGLNGQSIVWKGSLRSAPSNPEELWAYYNTETGSSYIFSEGSWKVLAGRGASISWLGSYSSAPENPVLYEAYYNSTDGCSYIYDGTKWTLLAQKGNDGDDGEKGETGLDGQSIVWKGSLRSAPINAEELWAYYNTETGNSYIFSNGTWKILAGKGASISWLGSFTSEPDNPVLYEAYYNTTDGCSYIYDGTKWTLLAQKGSKGDTGEQGIQGAQGIQGLQGTSIVWKGSFSTYPENPENLWAFFNLTNGCSYIYQDGTWNLIAVSGATINWLGSYATAPTDAEYYDAYFNETDGCTYLYSGTDWILIARGGAKGDTGDKGDPGIDGTSIIWKGSFATAPTNAQDLWAYFNTTDGNSYIYNNGSWSLLAGRGASIDWLGSFSTAPENPELYEAYYNTTDGCSYIYDGTKWALLAQKGSKGDTGEQGIQGLQGISITWKGSYSSSTALSNPQDLWAYFNTSDGCSYIYQDGSWNLLASSGATITWLGDFATAPEDADVLDAYYNTTTGCTYIYYEGSWQLMASKGEKGDTGAKGDAGLDGTPIIWKGSYATAPTNPSELWAYYNTTDGCSYIYNENNWTLLAKAGTSIYWAGSFDEAPSSPSLYWAYYNNLTGCSYIYDGTKWTLLAMKGDVGETGPTGAKGADGADGTSIIWKGSYAFETDIENPQELWAYYNTTNGCSYIYSDDSWQLLASSSSMDSERTMIIGYVDAEERSSKAKIYVTLSSVTTTEVVYKTYTNSSGYFAFSCLSAGEYIVSVSESGYEAATSESITVQSGKTSDAGTISLKLEKGVLTGQVVLDGNTDYSGVTVELIGTDYTTTTDVDGVYKFSLIPGTYSGGIRYQKKNYQTVVTSDSVVIKKNEQLTLGAINLNLTTANTVSGTVKLKGSSDSGSIEVQLFGSNNYTATTDSTGFFKFTDVQLGSYTLSAKKEGLSTYSKTVEVTCNETVKLGTFNYEYISLVTPTFNYTDGTYDNILSVEISGTEGAEIYYTLDGTTPTTESNLYSSAFNVAKTTTVKAISHKNGVYSEVATVKYTMKVSDVVASVSSGNYSKAQSVELTCSTSDAKIYYTLDSSTPTKSSILYTSPIEISDDVTIKAVAIKGSFDSSNVLIRDYTFNKPDAPVFSLEAGTYEEGNGITISALGCQIYYTTDGTEPTSSSNLYTSQIPLSQKMTLKAIAYKNGLKSGITTVQYIVKVSNPVASVASGTYLEEKAVTLSTFTADATIYYTTNGKTPSTTSTLYTGPITVSKNTTIKAIAVKAGLETSSTASFSYVIDKQSGSVTIEDPDYRDFSITPPAGMTSGATIDVGESGTFTATLSPSSLEATYSWYIDDELISSAESINIGSYSDLLVFGSHIIRAEASVDGTVYSDNFLLKVTE